MEDELQQESFCYFDADGSLAVINTNGIATLQVMDVLGRVLSSEQLSGSCEKKFNVAPGVYVLRLVSGDDIKVQKIAVK